MVNGLAEGLRSIDQEVLALSAPIPPAEVLNQCRQHGIDIVMQVNRTRVPDVKLPGRVRYISWYQDVFPETTKNFSERFHDSDILYALGDPEVLGLHTEMPCYVGSLLSGVDQKTFNHMKTYGEETVDFSLCGFIPAPPQTRGLFKIMQETVELNYQPLHGSLDIHALETEIRKNMAPYPNKFTIAKSWLLNIIYRLRHGLKKNDGSERHLLSPFERSISFYTREYPRLLDRVALIDQVLAISQSLELFGPGWDRHDKYKTYFKGVISRLEDLLDVYRRSSINLANNTHGLGLHSRTLECMAVGGFVFTHESPHDNKSGGMLTCFEPGLHFGSFNTDNMQEQAKRWLADEKKRLEAGKQASAIVSQQHCWQHRARQVINDLLK